MQEGHDEPVSPSRPLAVMELFVAVVITCAGGALCLSMPNLVDEGGIKSAQDFLRVSPVFFPRLTFGVVAILGLSYLFRALVQLRGDFPPSGEARTGVYLRVLAVTLMVVSYAALLPWLGFGLATLLMIGGLTIFLGNWIWWQVALISVLGPVVVRFVFERVLSISLPRASVEFVANVEEALMKTLTRIIFIW